MTEPPAPAPRRAARPTQGGSFALGAKGRLLPASVPLRYFGAAAVFHAAAWLLLLANATDWIEWRGGLGTPLAALHLVTLGTLLASAIGASLQLLPVATRQAVRSQRLAAALWWIYVPGIAALALGMGLSQPQLVAAGAAAVIAALLAWGALLALNLHGARGMPGVVLHGWGALAALALLAASAVALVMLWLGRPVIDRDAARALHLAAGLFGTMGLLAFGLSYIVLPMFALAAVPAERQQLAAGGAAVAAVALAAAAAYGAAALPLRVAAVAMGALALALHLRLVRGILASGMRSDFGRALAAMRIAWASLGVALAVALALALGAPADPWGRVFGVVAVGGWLLGFLFGVLQRILPFLASMHAAQGQKRPPTPSALTPERPLKVHHVCHPAALALLVAATIAGSAPLARLAAAVGSVGALAFVVFVVGVTWRLRSSAPPAEPTRDAK